MIIITINCGSCGENLFLSSADLTNDAWTINFGMIGIALIGVMCIDLIGQIYQLSIDINAHDACKETSVAKFIIKGDCWHRWQVTNDLLLVRRKRWVLILTAVFFTFNHHSQHPAPGTHPILKSTARCLIKILFFLLFSFPSMKQDHSISIQFQFGFIPTPKTMIS